MPSQMVSRLPISMRLKAALSPLLFARLSYGCASEARAQYRFDTWTTDNGLPQNTVNALLQTRDGYLWIATNAGLARFDGARFTVFDRGRHPRIGSNRMTALYEDRHGTLWIGTHEGLLVRYRDGEFFTFTSEQGLAPDEILWIEEDAQGSLWLTGTKSITRWQDGRGTVYAPEAYLPGLKREADQRDRVWWSVDPSGLHLFFGGRAQSYTRQEGLPNLNITAIDRDRRGNVLIGTADAGAVKLKDGKLTVYPLNKAWWPGKPMGNIAYEDRHGDLWMLDREVLLRATGGKLTRYPSFNAVAPVFHEDREGTLWLGDAHGLFRARPLVIRALTDEIIQRRFIYPGEWVYTILEDRTGTVWMGKWGGGVTRYRDGRFTHYVGGPDWKANVAAAKERRPANLLFEEALFSARVTSLYEDRAGVIWVGTDEGLSRFKDGQFTRFSDQHGLVQVWAMHEDRAGNFWFGTRTGLTRLRDGQFTVYTTRDGLAYDDVKVILEDRQGALWLGTHGGLTRYADGRFTTFAELSTHQVRMLYEDADGVLWIGTYGSGLYRFKDGKFTHYTTKEGLHNNGVFQILEDGRGHFWMSCNLGIYRVRKQELNDFADGKIRRITSTSYGKEDGMLNLECNGGRQPAGWKMRDGKLWFPTMEGVAIVDPEAIPASTLPPPVVIEEVHLNDQAADFRRGVTIPPGESKLEIRYTGLSFIKPEQIRFRYRLEGLEPDWVEAGTSRIAHYSHLPPGRYTFRVKAANIDGVWNEQGASFEIIVVPPFWRTWRFAGLMLLSVVGATGLGYRRHISRLKREQQQREEMLQRERAMKEAFSRELLTSREDERARIARELHDDLKPELFAIKQWSAEAQPPAAPEQAEERFDKISAKADQAVDLIAEIVNGLRPPILEAGLTEGLKAIVLRAARASRTRYLDEIGEVDGVLPPHLEIQLYYIVHEAVFNHSPARAGDRGQGFSPPRGGCFAAHDSR
jgi:ligand-binding sensor domain-containing protein